jgi:hypothetical protein
MGKKHPLELFRENPEGFENASRTRRTVTGRVVGTALRPAPPAVSAAREGKRGGSAKRPSTGSRPAARKNAGKRGPIFTLDSLRPTNKKALYSVLAIFGAFSLYLMGASSGTPALKTSTEEVFSTGEPTTNRPATPPPAATVEYAVLAATYGGSEHGKEISTIWRDVLREDGYPRAEIVGYPGEKDGSYDRIELLVGRATHQADLNGLLDQVRRYQGPSNDPAPFRDAYVIEVPEAVRTGS